MNSIVKAHPKLAFVTVFYSKGGNASSMAEIAEPESIVERDGLLIIRDHRGYHMFAPGSWNYVNVEYYPDSA